MCIALPSGRAPFQFFLFVAYILGRIDNFHIQKGEIFVMRIMSLYDIDLAIKTNDLLEVTSSRIYSGGNTFNENGLMSERIFGISTEDRMYKCGYIKLPCHVFNPDVAKTIINRGGGIIRKCAYGEVACDIVNGVLTKKEGGNICGFEDLYKNWEKIDIEKTLSSKVANNLTILTKSPKKVLFVDKVLVLPPNFRPIGERNGRPVKAELNNIYGKMLGLKDVSAHTSGRGVYPLYGKIQDSLVELYTYIAKYLGGKNGFLQRHLLAKNSQMTQRNVISAPRYNKNKSPIGIFKTGYPLHTVVGLFLPFIKFQMKEFLSFSNLSQIHSKPEEVEASVIENLYDSTEIDALIKIYGKNTGNRFRKLYLDAEGTKEITISYYDNDKKEDVTRPLTLTDVVYICAKRAVENGNKTCLLTRYPIASYKGTFFTKVHILSTNNTRDITFQGERMEYYPDIDPDAPHNVVAISFADTVTPSNSRLAAIGGDYDGDTVKSVGIWSDEGNEQAEKLMYSKIYSVQPNMESMYEIAKGCLNGLYSATKRKSK